MRFPMICVCCFAIMLPGFLQAQDNKKNQPAVATEDSTNQETPSKDGSSEKEKTYGTMFTRPLPQNWSIKNEVSTIERSLENYDPLIQSLEEANNDLKVDLAEYLKNPEDQVLAAKITAKMSKYAKKIVGNVDKIGTEQDVLLEVFNELNQKLQKFGSYLDFKSSDIQSQVGQYQTRGKDMRRQLHDLALKIQEAGDPQVKEQYKQDFHRMFSKYNINSRYEEGFSRNQRDYQTLSQNLKSLVQMFTILHQAFGSLIDNLQAEKQYLLDNIRLQADAIQVQKLVHEGVSDGSRAVVNITKKLALLYAQVEGFAKVHEKINRDMAKFADSTKILGSLVTQIEKAPFSSAPTIDKAIEYFASIKE